MPAKRMHYICSPNYPVATRKRIEFTLRRTYFFSITECRLLCVSESAVCMYDKGSMTSIAVALPAAKILASYSLFDVYALDTSNIIIEDEEAFVESMLSRFRVTADDMWQPPKNATAFAS